MAFIKITIIILITLQMSCSHLGKSSTYKNSIISNLNPAPSSMAPPPGGVLDSSEIQAKADYYFTIAQAYSLEGKVEKSIEAYKSTLLYDDNAAIARIALAEGYAKIGYMSEALEQAEKVIEVAPKNIDARLLLGSLYSALKMYELSLSQYYVAMDLDKNNIEAPMYIGAIYAEQKKYVEAIQHFKNIAKEKIGDEKEYLYQFYIARVYLSMGEKFYPQAEKYLQKSISLNTEYYNTTLTLSKLYLMQKNTKKAMQLLQSYQQKFFPEEKIAELLADLYIEDEKLDLAYGQLEVLEEFRPEKKSIKLRMVILLIKLKKHREAIEKLKILLVDNPDSDKLRFYLASVYEEEGMFAEAILEYSHISDRSFFYSDALIKTTYLHSKLGEDKKSLEVLKVAIKNDTNAPSVYVFYATILDKLKKYDEVVSVLNKGLKLFPNSTQMHFIMGTAYDSLKLPEKTIHHMKQIINMNANHVQALNYLAYTYAVIGKNLEEGEKLVNKALELKPNDGYIMDTKGWLHFKKGEYKKAIKYLEIAYKLKSDESIIAEHLGDAYYGFQQVGKARKMYQVAIKAEVDAEKQKEIQFKINATTKQMEKLQRIPASVKND